MKIVVDEMFKRQYLRCGQTYDNFIFENCPYDFIKIAKCCLSEEDSNVKPCNVKITKELEERIENTLDNCVNKLQKDILARDFVTALVMKEVLKDVTEKREDNDAVVEQIKAYDSNDFDKIKKLLSKTFMLYDVIDFSKRYQKIELNFFLVDVQSKTIQKAVNNFISSRLPFSVKIFTTNERLVSYYDQAGNLIQSPHDFMTRDVNEFIEYKNEKGLED